jgi:hypothetical protein
MGSSRRLTRRRKTPPKARFPDSRIDATRTVFPVRDGVKAVAHAVAVDLKAVAYAVVGDGLETVPNQ